MVSKILEYLRSLRQSHCNFIIGRAGVPMEVMGLMLGQFVDEYTITCVDVFAMPQVSIFGPWNLRLLARTALLYVSELTAFKTRIKWTNILIHSMVLAWVSKQSTRFFRLICLTCWSRQVVPKWWLDGITHIQGLVAGYPGLTWIRRHLLNNWIQERWANDTSVMTTPREICVSLQYTLPISM